MGCLCWRVTDGAGEKKRSEGDSHSFYALYGHRQALTSKTLDPELKSALDTAIKIINYINSGLRLFTTVCRKWGGNMKVHLHTEGRVFPVVRCFDEGNIFDASLQGAQESCTSAIQCGHSNGNLSAGLDHGSDVSHFPPLKLSWGFDKYFVNSPRKI